MRVKVRERVLANDDIAFHIDIYHKGYKRFVQATGVTVNPKHRKAYNQAKAEVLDKVRIIEKDLQFDASAGFSSASITRMKQIWFDVHKAWNKRDMSLSKYA